MNLLADPTAPAGRRNSALTPLFTAGASFLAAGSAIAVIAALLLSLIAVPARAASVLPEWRVATSFGSGENVAVYAGAWHTDGPRLLRARQLEIALGVIDAPEQSRLFAFVGPVWRVLDAHSGPFLDLSFGPTLITGSSIGGRELGGNFHFRSALALGVAFGRTVPSSIALRVEHISNGGLRDANPGLDLVGLSFVTGFGAH